MKNKASFIWAVIGALSLLSAFENCHAGHCLIATVSAWFALGCRSTAKHLYKEEVQ